MNLYRCKVNINLRTEQIILISYPPLLRKYFYLCAMKIKFKITKNSFLKGFMIVTAFLALVRLIFPSVAKDTVSLADSLLKADTAGVEVPDSIKLLKQSVVPKSEITKFYKADGNPIKNKIFGVIDYDASFPDSQMVQLATAQKYGVKAVANRKDAESRKKELVYIGSNPYFDVKRLSNSVPYLVPRATILLQDIGRNFMDSLQVKGLPLNKILVTSVLRTKEDVEKLRRHNGNATENSCHLYGTTFDIAYNKYNPVEKEAPGDKLKYILCEVLDDLRKQGRCYIKYEKMQGCFHITVR